MTQTQDPTQAPSASREISRGLISIYKDHTDRGPAAARTTISDHHVVTVLETALTKAERTLVAGGEASLVREIRRKFQKAMAEEVRALTERVTGRESVALLSDHDVELDIAVEIVILAEDTGVATAVPAVDPAASNGG